MPATVRFTIYDSGQVTSPAGVFQQFIGSVESGQIKLSISKIFKLDDIVEAHKLMENNRLPERLLSCLKSSLGPCA